MTGKLRDLARAHAADAIEELARLAVNAKSETARIAAIKELLDRAYGKATQFLAADNDVVPEDVGADELRADIFADFQRIFPDYRLVPSRTLKVIAGPDGTTSQKKRSPATY